MSRKIPRHCRNPAAVQGTGLLLRWHCAGRSVQQRSAVAPPAISGTNSAYCRDTAVRRLPRKAPSVLHCNLLCCLTYEAAVVLRDVWVAQLCQHTRLQATAL
jgi:hypothetical protein